MPGQHLALITENDLYPTRCVPAHAGAGFDQGSDVEAMVRDLSSFAKATRWYVQHGIGRYHGLIGMDLGEGVMEFLHLEYAQGATCACPFPSCMIARYSGADPKVRRCISWVRNNGNVPGAKTPSRYATPRPSCWPVCHARRSQSHTFKLSPKDYGAFAEGFGFEETPDQAQAIRAVIEDMTSGRPMDRLVCGDVGFGKTEVALRAAFVAVMDGKQVVMLCPTTLLAEQHAQTFIDRFAGWPVNIVELSRFRSPKQVKAAVDGLADGSVDIVIGTHKILSKDVRFKQLGW